MEVVEATEIQEATEMQEAEVAPAPQQSVGFTQELKNRFIEGGPGFMGIVLACLILGLAIAIERIIYLNFATTNTSKLIDDVESALNLEVLMLPKKFVEIHLVLLLQFFTKVLIELVKELRVLKKLL